MLSTILGKYHKLGDAACGGTTVFSKDMLFMDHCKLGYPCGHGPGNERILSASGNLPPRWTPIIVIREDNQTCITTNVSGKNGLMKKLERAFGCYVILELCQTGIGRLSDILHQIS